MRKLVVVFVLAAIASTGYAIPAVCPDGWVGVANTTDGSVRCFVLQREQLAPINIDYYCRTIMPGLETSGGKSAHAVSIHSASESAFVTSLQPDTSCVPVALGGAMAYGEQAWFDHTTFDYTAPMVALGDGCLIANCDGSWSTVACSEGSYPFVCAISLAPIASDNVTAAPTLTPSVTSAPIVRATRPPSTGTSCPALWTFDSTSGKCYRAYNNTYLSVQQAESFCMAQAANGHLTSVYDESETSTLKRIAANYGISYFFVGALFMSNGEVGSWYEDNSWYGADTFAASSPSSPAWPTISNRYFSAWAPSEPAASFGCIKMSASNGWWYEVNCQTPLPYICSFLNDGSTYTPTTTSITTAVPTPVPTAAVPCATGWKGLRSTNKCYRLATKPSTGYQAEATCQALIPAAPTGSIHATAITSAEAASLLANMTTVTSAFIGATYISYGADGMFTDYSTDWDPSASLIKALWGAGQPDMESGCMAMHRGGYLIASSCSSQLTGVLCSYDGSISMPEGGTTRPPTTTDPANLGAAKVVSLSYRSRLVVASSSRGIYSVQHTGGVIEGKLMLFTPSPNCALEFRQAYVSAIYNGHVVVHHDFPVANGTICYSQDGITFQPTNLTFTVVDASLAGIISTDFSDWRSGLATTMLLANALDAEISLQRRSSGVLYLVGRNVMDTIKSVRFSSSPDCMDSLYVYGSPYINVTGEVASYELIDIQPLNFSNVQALDNRASTDPVIRYFVCVAVEGPRNDLVFTLVPGLTVQIPPTPIRFDGFIVGSGAVNSTLSIVQYGTPSVSLSAKGLNVAMLFYLSSHPSSCQFVEDLPLYPDPYDTQSPPSLSTALPVYIDSSVTGKGTPYIRFSLNHTRLEGYPITGGDVTFYLCLAMSSFEPPQPTTFTVVIKRQTIRSLLTEYEEVPEVPVPLKSVNVGYSGLLQLNGLNFDGLSLETLSTIRVAFAPSYPASLASLVSNECANQSKFYRQKTFPIVSIASLSRNNSNHTDAAIILAPGTLNKEVTRRLRVCLSVVHAHDSSERTFVPTPAYLDIRSVQFFYIGSASAALVNANGSNYATVVVPENADHFVLPLVGYGIRADMTLFLARTPCFLEDRDPDAYMAQTSLLNMSISDLYDVPLKYRTSVDETSSSIPYLVFTRSQHTDTTRVEALFGANNRKPLYMCVRAPGFEAGILSIPFNLVIKRPYVTAVNRADASSSSKVVYSSTVDLLVSGFGLADSTTLLIPALDCADPLTYLWWSPVPLTTVPQTIPSTVNYTRYFNAVSSMGSYFLSLTPDQTARIGTLSSLQVPQIFKWCAQFDPVLPFEPINFNYTVSLLNITGFVNPAFPGIVDTTLNLVTLVNGSTDYTSFRMVGSLIDQAVTVQDSLYLAFIPMNSTCAGITNSSNFNIDNWILLVNNSVILLPTQVPSAGQYKVCYTTLLPSSKANYRYQATVRFVEAKGLKVSVTVPTYSLFTINGTASLNLYTRQEWILPLDGVGLSNRSTLRITNSSTCEAIKGIEDIPVHVATTDMTFFGKKAAYYIFVQTETTQTLYPQRYSVCLVPTSARPWAKTSVVVNMVKRVRTPTWYRYFTDSDEGNITSVTVKKPTKIVRATNLSTIYIATGTEMSMLLKCGSQTCPDRARVILARMVSGDRPDPCFVDEFDFPGEYAKGPYVLHDGILTLSGDTTASLYSSVNAESNWTLCVETGPSFWRQPQRPYVRFTVRDTYPTEILRSPDDNNNSTFARPYPTGFDFSIRAAGPTRVFYLNGAGIRKGTSIRFGPNCTNVTESALNATANSLLLTSPLTIIDAEGAFFFPASHYLLQESSPLPMCFAAADATTGVLGPYQNTTIRLNILKATQRTDDGSTSIDTSHTPLGALRDTIQLPCNSHGSVNLTSLTLRDGTKYPWTAGTQVLISRDCMYSTEGRAVIVVDSRLHITFSNNDTRVPTSSPLLVCVRRYASYTRLNETGYPEVLYAFESSTFTTSGFKFQVASVQVSSVSATPMVPLTGATDDVTFIVAIRAEEELVLQLSLTQPASQSSSSTDTSTEDYFDSVLHHMNSPAALVAFGLVKFAAGSICQAPAESKDVASVRSLVTNELIFSSDATTVNSQSVNDGDYFVNLPVGKWGDPLNPQSLCLSVDGGRYFVSVGIAVFDVEWKPTLAVISSSSSTQQSVITNVNVYENTEVTVEVADTRYSKYFTDLRDPTLASLAAFAEVALWEGYVNDGFGMIEGMRLMMAASYVSVGENFTSGLLFSIDYAHSAVSTGVTITILPLQLKCAEAGANTIYAHHLEPGATFDITPGVCAFGLNDGSMVRYAPSCVNASFDYVGDGIITGSRLSPPPTIAYIRHGVYDVCIKRYLDPVDVPAAKAEAQYLPTGLALAVSSKVGVHAINDVSTGILALFQGEPGVLAVSGSGIGNGNIVLAFPKATSNCSVATQFVDGNGVETMSSIDPLAVWVEVEDNIARVNVTSTTKVVPGDAGKRLVCVSVNGGVSFSPVGEESNTTLYAAVVPPTVTSVSASYDTLSSTRNVASTVRIPANATDAGTFGPFANSIPPVFVFSNSISFAGNGIGSYSQRSTPLLTAIFPSKSVEVCNGPVSIADALAIFSVDGTTGAAKIINGSRTSLPAGPSEAFVVCTSADDGQSFYSANGAFLPSVSSEAKVTSSSGTVGMASSATVLTVERYVSEVFITRFDEGTHGNQRGDDATLILDTVVVAEPFTQSSFDLDAIQNAFASTIGVSATFVAVMVSPMPLVNVSHSYYLSVKMLASTTSTIYDTDRSATVTAFMAPIDAYQRWISILTSPGNATDLAYRRTNLTRALEANLTSSARVSILRSHFATSGGWQVNARDTPALASISVDLLSTNVRGYEVQSSIGVTDYSTIPIVMLFPCFLVIATYFTYKRFFGDESGEGEVKAESA